MGPLSGAAILDGGDNVRIDTAEPCSLPTARCPASMMRKLTANALRLFGPSPAWQRQPSHANWQVAGELAISQSFGFVEQMGSGEKNPLAERRSVR